MAYRKIGSHRETKNFVGTRLAQPSGLKKDSYFSVKTKTGYIVLAESKKTGKTVVHAKWKKKNGQG
jgi:hypothetical protein